MTGAARERGGWLEPEPCVAELDITLIIVRWPAQERKLEAGALKLAPSLPFQGDDPDEERDDDGRRDRLGQPVSACDREKYDARDDHE